MVNVIVLGNCSTQTERYETTCFVIETDSAKILLDAGPGVVRQLKLANISPAEIDAVIISHCHGDHTLGFPFFLYADFVDRVAGKTGPEQVPVIALGAVYNGLTAMTAFTFPPGKFPRFEFPNWEASAERRSSFELKGIEITTVPVSHSTPAFGVCLKAGPVKAVFSCDTSYNADLVELAQGCDLLSHETYGPASMVKLTARFGHSTAPEAGRAAANAKAKMLMLSHISPPFLEDPGVLIDEASKEFDGRIIVPSGLETIVLG
jgi:ribonuclease Z